MAQFMCTVRGTGNHPENSDFVKKYAPDANAVGKRVATFLGSLKKPDLPTDKEGSTFVLSKDVARIARYMAASLRYHMMSLVAKQFKDELSKGKNHGQALVSVLKNPTAGIALHIASLMPDTNYQVTALASTSMYLNTDVKCKNRKVVGKTEADTSLIGTANLFYGLARKRAGDFETKAGKRIFSQVNCRTRGRVVNSGFRFIVALLNWARKLKTGYCGGGTSGGSVNIKIRGHGKWQ